MIWYEITSFPQFGPNGVNSTLLENIKSGILVVAFTSHLWISFFLSFFLFFFNY